jgi:hypothetical protein
MRISVLIRNSKQLMALLLVAGFMFTAAYTTQAQTRPIVPMLSLMGEIDGYNKEFYPDGRIVIPPSEENPREFLVPVFIENRWETFNERYVVPADNFFQIQRVLQRGSTPDTWSRNCTSVVCQCFQGSTCKQLCN